MLTSNEVAALVKVRPEIVRRSVRNWELRSDIDGRR
jgi:hypothetical protein